MIGGRIDAPDAKDASDRLRKQRCKDAGKLAWFKPECYNSLHAMKAAVQARLKELNMSTDAFADVVYRRFLRLFPNYQIPTQLAIDTDILNIPKQLQQELVAKLRKVLEEYGKKMNPANAVERTGCKFIGARWDTPLTRLLLVVVALLLLSNRAQAYPDNWQSDPNYELNDNNQVVYVGKTLEDILGPYLKPIMKQLPSVLDIWMWMGRQ